MEWLNYHHLLYFWAVAREGGVNAASCLLHVSQPTISGQVRVFEHALGFKLFHRAGRGLALTDRGRAVFTYADRIFSLGHDLQRYVREGAGPQAMRFAVGIADALPRTVAYELVVPVLSLEQPMRVVCRQDRADRLLAELSTGDLDLVLADAPMAPGARVRAFNHLLGECAVSFFARERIARAHRAEFPRSLDGAPVLLPTEHANLRRLLDQWFDDLGVHPTVVAESEDSTLLKVFGQAGHGIFPASSVVEGEVRRQFGVRLVGRAQDLRERFYAISLERRIRHPAVAAISDRARTQLFD